MEKLLREKTSGQYKLPKDKKRLNQYQQGILNPSIANDVRIPGTWGRSSVVLRRSAVVTLNTNASGHLCLEVQPEIHTTTGTTSSTILYNGTYDPSVTTPYTGVPVNTNSWYNLTAGTARGCRLVGMSITMTSLSTALNRRGTIYGLLLPDIPRQSAVFASSSVNDCSTIPNTQHCWKKRANVYNGEGVTVCYVPSDEDDLDFLAPDTEYSVRHPNSDDIYKMVFICQGLEASSQVRIEIYTQFEVIPVPGGSLAGVEARAPSYNSIPAWDIAHLKTYHLDSLIRISGAFSNGVENRLIPAEDNNQQSNISNAIDVGLNLIPGGNYVRAAATSAKIVKNAVDAYMETQWDKGHDLSLGKKNNKGHAQLHLLKGGKPRRR